MLIELADDRGDVLRVFSGCKLEGVEDVDGIPTDCAEKYCGLLLVVVGADVGYDGIIAPELLPQLPFFRCTVAYGEWLRRLNMRQ